MKKIFLVIASALALCVGIFFIVKKSSVKDEHVLVVGTNAEFAPFAYVEQGVLKGFDVQAMEAIAVKLGKQIVWKDMPFDMLLLELQNGTIDIVAAGLTPTSEREAIVSFSKHYHAGTPLTVVTLKKNVVIKSLDELKGKKVIVNDGYTADTYMSKHYPNVSLLRIPTVTDAFLSLMHGQGDAYVSAYAAARPFFNQYGADKFAVFYIPNTGEAAALAIGKNNTELLAAVNTAIDELRVDGTLQDLEEAWNIAS